MRQRAMVLLLSVTVSVLCLSGLVVVSSASTQQEGVTTAALIHRGMLTQPLKIASFNIQILGKTKMANAQVVAQLIKILLRYDLVLVQEIRDSSQTAFPELVSKLNRETDNDNFGYTQSRRLGRSTSKEQYAYLYNKTRLELRDTFQYGDPNDDFEREPYCAHFRSHDTAISDFGVVGIHTKPDAAETEISLLTKVYDKVTGTFGTKDILLMGDFNADCSYVTKAEWSTVALRTDSRFTWLVGDDVDTTVATTDCAYDRFVVAGDRLKNAIAPKSVGPFLFDSAYGLDDDLAKDVSDHYPIELEIYGKVSPAVLLARVVAAFSVLAPEPAEGRSVEQLGVGQTVAGYSVATSSPDATLRWNGNCTEVVKSLEDLRRQSSGLLSVPVLALVEAYLQAGTLHKLPLIPSLGPVETTLRDCDVIITYGRQDAGYTVSVSKRAR